MPSRCRRRRAASSRLPSSGKSWRGVRRCSSAKKRRLVMLREVGLFGALVPSLLFYVLAAVALFLLVDRLASCLGLYHLFWHPPLVRLALFVCLLSGLVLVTGP